MEVAGCGGVPLVERVVRRFLADKESTSNGKFRTTDFWWASYVSISAYLQK
jgi:hypothetical protein